MSTSLPRPQPQGGSNLKCTDQRHRAPLRMLMSDRRHFGGAPAAERGRFSIVPQGSSGSGDRLDVIETEAPVSGDDRDVFQLGLSHQQAIEGIPVVRG